MQTHESNPFLLYFDKNSTLELEKDHLYKQTISFFQLKPLADMMVRLNKKIPNEHDFELRDVIDTGLFPEGASIKLFLYK